MSEWTPLEIATRCYYWKPMAALFRSLELRLYRDAGFEGRPPVLDLGCGDGQVSRMLNEMGLMDRPFCGSDLGLGELRKAAGAGGHHNLVAADANRLPFADESFATVLANGVLCSIWGGIEPSLAEIHRVLRPEGCFALTVPTDRFLDVLLFPRMLGTVSDSLRSGYSKRLYARLPHFTTHPASAWIESLEGHGLQVVKSEQFFSRRAGRLWNLLSMQICRSIGLLKLAGGGAVGNLAAGALRAGFRGVYSGEQAANGPRGYLFMIARKTR